MMAERLYTAREVAVELGLTRPWVLKHAERMESPQPDYETMHGESRQLLWTKASLDSWRAYHASAESVPNQALGRGYSDHRAVNKFGYHMVTWKLWWHPLGDGGTKWWYSTPLGWYTSEDDGKMWDPYGSMTRPKDYHYYSVVQGVGTSSALGAVLRNAEKLRLSIESGEF